MQGANRHKTMLRSMLNGVIIICCIGALISIYMLISSLYQYRREQKVYTDLTGFVSVAPWEPGTGKATAPQVEPAPASGQEVVASWPEVDFDALAAQNRDVVAWLICPDTSISYPVVQGDDNDYYLTHLFDGSPGKAGCLFVDSGNSPDFGDANTVIYGHYTKDHSMFYTLSEYKQQAFFDSHPTMLLLTPQGNYTVALFAGYVANTAEDSWRMTFDGDEDYLAWLAEARRRSTFSSDVSVDGHEKVITFSTCSYEFDDARYVLLGKLVAAS